MSGGFVRVYFRGEEGYDRGEGRVRGRESSVLCRIIWEGGAMEMWECKAVRADDRPFLSPPPLPFEWPTLLSGSASLPPHRIGSIGGVCSGRGLRGDPGCWCYLLLAPSSPSPLACLKNSRPRKVLGSYIYIVRGNVYLTTSRRRLRNFTFPLWLSRSSQP